MPAKLTTLSFIQRSKDVHNNKFTYEKTVYTNSKTSVVITCINHGDISVNPNNHINNKSGCPLCYGRIKKTTEQFIDQVRRLHGDVFTFEHTNYSGDGIKVTVTCKQHGDFTPTPSNILQGSGCPLCALEEASKRNRKDQSLFIEQASKLHFHKYDYSLVEYKNSATPITIICPKHGKFSQQPTVHIDQRCGCPRCTSSRGEMEVREYLQTLNLKFNQQQMFKECKDKRRLKFDFFLPDYGILIEYNGLQHYRTVPLLKYNRAALLDIQRKDKIKQQFAKEKGLQLLVIPFNAKTHTYLDQHLTPLVSVAQSFL